jgi:hypothetical protein
MYFALFSLLFKKKDIILHFVGFFYPGRFLHGKYCIHGVPLSVFSIISLFLFHISLNNIYGVLIFMLNH